MLRRTLNVILTVALVSAACTDGQSTLDGALPERERPELSILPPADTNGPGANGGDDIEQPENNDNGRLVVQSSDFQLSTMLHDGSDVVELTDPGTINYQAAWAPDGSRIAWIERDPSTQQVTIALDRFDRSDYRNIEVDSEPFYLYWDPSAARIAHLDLSPAGIDLSIAEPFAEDGPTDRRIDRGEPYFLTWGPDGDELLVHASGFRLDRIDLGSATIIIEEFPGAFGAPTWLPDDSLVFTDTETDAETEIEEQFLITTGASGEGRRPLITYDGSLRFAVSNSGNRIVMQAVPLPDDESIVTASAVPTKPGELTLAAQTEPTPTPGFDDSLDAIDPIQLGIPYAMGTFGGEPFALSTQPALAIFPSPDGQSIAWLEAIPTMPEVMVLNVDAGGRTFSTEAFIPSDELAENYLPFFDQYEQSHDFWSPSSQFFVYAGQPLSTATDDIDGIWIFDRETGTSRRIADGAIASFTHTPAAAGAASAL